jgi:hypothetical protein
MNLYSTRKLLIPQPEFFVLYNGAAPYPDADVIKLSDMFKSLEPLGLPERTNPVLELEVKILNINEGKNNEKKKKSSLLSQYSAFIGKVREFEHDGYIRQEAVKEAVKYCRSHDILKEFLIKNTSEVFNMLMTEWNWDDALAVRYKEGREDKSEEIARNALAKGYSVEEINDLTGLAPEVIRELENPTVQRF